MKFLSYEVQELHEQVRLRRQPQIWYNQEGNMKLTVCVLAVLVGSGFAIDGPRLNVLTGDARLMLDDFSEIWAYPGTMAKYQFGIVTSEQPNDESSEWGLGWFGGVMDIEGTTWGATHNHDGNLLEVLYHGGSYGLIVGVDYSSTPADTMGEVTVDGEDAMGINVAFGNEINLFGDYTDLSIGAGYSSLELSDVEYTLTKDTYLNLGASVRGHQDGLFNLFPIISAGFSQLKNEFYDGEGNVAYSESGSTISLDFGAGINKMYAPNTQVVFGAFMGLTNTSYSTDQEDTDAQDSEMSLEILDLDASVEQHLFRWLALRGGASSVTSYDKTGDADATIGTSLDSRFGLGIEIGNFTIDADITQSFLHDGPYLVGGNGNGFLGNIACTYDF
jgi:hypothetical protein